MTADYKALVAQRAELDAKIAQALKAEQSGAIAQARELVQHYGLTQAHIFGAPKKSKGAQGSVGQAKYRNPATGATWTGRGKPPRWIENQDRAAFAI
ncbi:H-NS histone family [Delftia tsuruhatensis]|uniref:H-NS histone family protein n=1 Tax=Delftia tsuruhatensis TaxID=180282 RepID=UPI001E73C8CA|nr:H-NS histone family protein [Delftia tsuruhatensis]CAB5670887.1 H-NS histone family [Delftia tsuruhatensis]CAC9683101.1 H-NS histone family [Delftia tsuruhatensis]